jgi:chemotaxis-related protein WspB
VRTHVLHLFAGDQRYALPSAHVVEVVPSVPLRKVPGAPAAVAGLLDYRGQVVPVVDLARRLGAPPAPPAYATRIVVCERSVAHATTGPAAGSIGTQRPLLGILAADVTHVGMLDPDAEGSHAGPLPDGVRTLGRVTRDAHGLVQLVTLEGLVDAELLARLDGSAQPAAEGRA